MEDGEPRWIMKGDADPPPACEYEQIMREKSFHGVIEKEPRDPGYFAWSPDLRGCFSAGSLVEEARRNMREAMELHLSSIWDRSKAQE